MNDLITWFDRAFKLLDSDWRELIDRLDDGAFYLPGEQRLTPCAEQILRSARIVEQSFGGITTNLWDDPFEWTLPETLTTRAKLISYLDEVRETRERGFCLFEDDADLLKTVAAHTGQTQLISLLLDTLVRAGHHQLKAKEGCRKVAVNSSFARNPRS